MEALLLVRPAQKARTVQDLLTNASLVLWEASLTQKRQLVFPVVKALLLLLSGRCARNALNSLSAPRTMSVSPLTRWSPLKVSNTAPTNSQLSTFATMKSTAQMGTSA
jgi:hypothetical protein